MMLENDAKMHVRTGALKAAKVMPMPMESGYMISVAIQEGSALQPYAISSARRDVRRFATVDSAKDLLDRLGIAEFRVISAPSASRDEVG